MTSQRLVEDFARWLLERDSGLEYMVTNVRVPDSYLNEAAVFLAGELGQRLQRGERIAVVDELEALPEYTVVVDQDNDAWQFIDGQWEGCGNNPLDSLALTQYSPLTVAWRPSGGAS